MQETTLRYFALYYDEVDIGESIGTNTGGECLHCDYTPRCGPTYTHMANIQSHTNIKEILHLLTIVFYKYKMIFLH